MPAELIEPRPDGTPFGLRRPHRLPRDPRGNGWFDELLTPAAGARTVAIAPGVTLLWAVPVVAAALATALLVARARAVEDACVDLAGEVAALRRGAAPLAAVRDATADTDALVAEFRDDIPWRRARRGRRRVDTPATDL